MRYEFNEVPIFFCAVAVSLNIAYHLAVYLSGGVEAERRLNQVILEVAVDGLRAAYNLHTGSYLLVVFGKHCSIGIAIVTTDDDKSRDLELLKYFETAVKLILSFKFGTAATDDIKAAGIAIFIYD